MSIQNSQKVAKLAWINEKLFLLIYLKMILLGFQKTWKINDLPLYTITFAHCALELECQCKKDKELTIRKDLLFRKGSLVL